MRYLVSTMLVAVGVIHLLPVLGALGADRLATLYGLAVDDPNLAILLRHRAILFGLLGLFLVLAAFKPALQRLAFLGGFVSVASFLGIAWQVGNYNPQVGRVVIADLVALGCLLVGFVAWIATRQERDVSRKPHL
jgi:hypothetical protein